MFSRLQRLTTKLFNELARKGVVSHSPHLSVRVREAQTPRYGVVVSKKVARRAVDRNLLKRRIRSIVAGIADGESREVIIYTKKGALELSFEELSEELTSLLTD